ncbi:hypothetical protein GEMRC1_013752 [Eukaryota sp. GEM-RC1]
MDHTAIIDVGSSSFTIVDIWFHTCLPQLLILTLRPILLLRAFTPKPPFILLFKRIPPSVTSSVCPIEGETAQSDVCFSGDDVSIFPYTRTLLFTKDIPLSADVTRSYLSSLSYLPVFS